MLILLSPLLLRSTLNPLNSSFTIESLETPVKSGFNFKSFENFTPTAGATTYLSPNVNKAVAEPVFLSFASDTPSSSFVAKSGTDTGFPFLLQKFAPRSPRFWITFVAC